MGHRLSTPSVLWLPQRPLTRLKRQNEVCLHLMVIHGGFPEAVRKSFQSAFQTLPSSHLSLKILLHLLSFVENDTGFFHW